MIAGGYSVLEDLMHLLALPINFEVKGGRNGSVLGEYTFLVTLHRLSYPSTLEKMEIIWGKDYIHLFIKGFQHRAGLAL